MPDQKGQPLPAVASEVKEKWVQLTPGKFGWHYPRPGVDFYSYKEDRRNRKPILAPYNTSIGNYQRCANTLFWCREKDVPVEGEYADLGEAEYGHHILRANLDWIGHGPGETPGGLKYRRTWRRIDGLAGLTIKQALLAIGEPMYFRCLKTDLPLHPRKHAQALMQQALRLLMLEDYVNDNR